jgi:hypothetical protein
VAFLLAAGRERLASNLPLRANRAFVRSGIRGARRLVQTERSPTAAFFVVAA